MKLWPATATLWKAYVESEQGKTVWGADIYVTTFHNQASRRKTQKDPIDQTLITLMIDSLDICRDKYTKIDVMWQLLTKEVGGGNKGSLRGDSFCEELPQEKTGELQKVEKFLVLF